ncbi:MAG: tRNA (guanosine(37)-N1)-methyltransferase TrmD [Desulfatiglans sp.]|jgi:tRNA (guanine37-N1)-methyltransferase|nr:tRNA (guanosine(37)-N1)-methyltransferase TrmD [Thermodesulfobacteriota bacterium]MEE4352042.1 tRNA (guanosine(37)-N1)-methyltransferase TrmD [Desulfatiglans sp.]
MRFEIVTIFPQMFSGYVHEGVLGRAVKSGIVEVNVVNIRDFARGTRKNTDDRPYGGGDGMVMKPGPIYRAVKHLERPSGRSLALLLSPRGQPFNQSMAWELSRFDQLILVCGRYEGVDERVRLSCIDRELSIGDYILSGGELGALVVVDAVSRLIPGVLGRESSNQEDSFEGGLLEYPQYTRPRTFEGQEVPEVLLSGDHERIRAWRRREALRRTMEKRPDLLKRARLSPEDEAILAELKEGG